MAALAPDVATLKIDDRVAACPSRPCAACHYCLEGLPSHCLETRYCRSVMRMPHVQGAFRNLMLCNTNRVHQHASFGT